MSLRSTDLWQMVLLTFSSPRAGLRSVLQMEPSVGIGMAGLVLMAVGSALLLHFSLVVSPDATGNPLIAFLISSPFVTALVQGGILLATAILVQAVGQAWGGKGRFEQSLATVVWLQAIFVLLQSLQLLALIALPPLSTVIGLMSVILFFWLLTQFVTELHGFTSPPKVFLAILLCIIAVSFLMSFILVGILGPEAFANV